MKSRPMLGSTGWMMMSSEPAMAAVAVARPKASVLMRVGLDAHQAKATGSCETAWIARPVEAVRQELMQQPIMPIETKKGTSMRPGRVMPPKVRLAPI